MSTEIRVEAWNGDPKQLAGTVNLGFSDTDEPLQDTDEDITERVRYGHADPKTTFIAWDGDTPVGVVFGSFRKDQRARAHALTVVPAYRGRGLARKLSDRFVQSADAHGILAIHCEVHANNEPAQSLYRSYGFVTLRRLSTFRGGVAPLPTTGLVTGGMELLPPPDDRPPPPLHRDRVAMERIPNVEVVRDPATGAWLAWAGQYVLDVGGPIDEAVVAKLLGSLPELENYWMVDVPREDPVFPILQKLRWEVTKRDIEMVRKHPTAAPSTDT